MKGDDRYRYHYLCPHASLAYVSQWLSAHPKGPQGLAYRVRDDGEWLPVALLDREEDVQALGEAFDIEPSDRDVDYHD